MFQAEHDHRGDVVGCEAWHRRALEVEVHRVDQMVLVRAVHEDHRGRRIVGDRRGDVDDVGLVRPGELGVADPLAEVECRVVEERVDARRVDVDGRMQLRLAGLERDRGNRRRRVGEAAENVGLDVVLPWLVDLRHLLVEREVRIRDRILADDVGEVVDRMRAVHPRAAGVGPARERDHVEGVLARHEL